MRLIIGGCGQGKLEWLKSHTGETYQEAWEIADGETCGADEVCQCRVLYRFHRLAWRMQAEGRSLLELLVDIREKNPDIWIISDEIGSGIIPADAFERTYREETGRALCRIAALSDEVYRLVCGIPRKLKG